LASSQKPGARAITALNGRRLAVAGVILVIAALSATWATTHRNGQPHRIVLPAGTMRQFTYPHLFGHTVACANGGAWKVTPKPKPINTHRIRVQFILDGYVNVFCPS
jgi:hypothetical protein